MHEKHLVIGAGEVGVSIHSLLEENYKADIRDVDDSVGLDPEVLHICYPPMENFTEVTKDYIRQYDPELVIIHSTVRPGTTSKIGDIAVHSPVRGIHPNLEKGIKTFVKYFGGPRADEAAKIFEEMGIETRTLDKAETTEVLKILSTTYYAWNIVFQKEVKRICDERGLDFDEVYTIPNNDYNEGYKKLGKEEVTRPVLKDMPGSIGGHCLVPNCNLLEDWITDTIKERNEKYSE